ncbi:hypothetical protein PIB30_071911 [Stylosanthes scabra]|uniref:Uncharacterized protein n=1 Tax=Stylosanthes scabra TaxID=79078 RepID=A0ABU6TR96_9FABA|nr:hypothetical protein [Stylosanthes scabra]
MALCFILLFSLDQISIFNQSHEFLLACLFSDFQIARKGKEVTSASTPSRIRTTKNSNRGRDDGFWAERFDSRIHYDNWKTMEKRGITRERIIRFPDGEPDFMHDCVEGLGWEFMYNAFAPINITMSHVFLRGKRIPFSEEDIRRNLGIHIELPPLGENDDFKETVEADKQNELDMDMIFHAFAWHKLIIANIDPKIHCTTFDMDHALLIFVLMTEGVVNLPRIMRDVLLKRPTGNSSNLLPYPIFISRMAIQHKVPEFPREEIYHIREQDMYCPYGDWKGEQPKVRRGRIICPA